MAEKTTFIKIDRNIIHWGWFKNPKVLSVFIWLLIRANIKRCRFEKDIIMRGSLVTSNAHIAEECGLTIDNVRTALASLEATGEITRQRRNRYQIITVVNYDQYQSDIRKTGHQIPIKSQSSPNQIPTIKEYKNGEEYKNGNLPLTGTFPCGANSKPEWMDEDRWEKIKYRTLDSVPDKDRGFYDSYIEYEEDHREDAP